MALLRDQKPEHIIEPVISLTNLKMDVKTENETKLANKLSFFERQVVLVSLIFSQKI